MEEGERRRGNWRSGFDSAPEEYAKKRSKRGSTRSSDGGAIITGEEAKQVDRREELRCGKVVCR
jgi:hypothetical protein